MWNNRRKEVRIARDIPMNGFAVHYFESDFGSKQRFCVKDMILQETPGHLAVDPLCWLGEDEVQTLMDDLWTAGVRPSKALIDKVDHKHLQGEIGWLREKVDFLIER